MTPGRPTYLESAYSKDDIGPNGVPLPPPQAGGRPAAAAPSTSPPADDPILEFRAAMRPQAPLVPQERPASPETTDALIQAVTKVHRVVTSRIKYHEAEAARLRASLAPFAGLANTGAPPSAQPSAEDATQMLLNLVKALPDPPETTS